MNHLALWHQRYHRLAITAAMVYTTSAPSSLLAPTNLIIIPDTPPEVCTTVAATTEAGPSTDAEGQHPGLFDPELGAQQPAHSPIDNQPFTSPDALDGSGNPRTSQVSMTPMLVSNLSCRGTPQKDPNEPEAAICINDEVLAIYPSSRVPFVRWRVRPDAFSVLKLAFKRHPETFENFNLAGPFIPVILLETLAKTLLDLDDRLGSHYPAKT